MAAFRFPLKSQKEVVGRKIRTPLGRPINKLSSSSVAIQILGFSTEVSKFY